MEFHDNEQKSNATVPLVLWEERLDEPQRFAVQLDWQFVDYPRLPKTTGPSCHPLGKTKLTQIDFFNQKVLDLEDSKVTSFYCYASKTLILMWGTIVLTGIQKRILHLLRS